MLLIAADAFTTLIDPGDRATAVIFADGAGAVVLREGDAGEAGAVGPVVLGSDGGLGHLIEVPAGGSRQKSSGAPAGVGEEFFRMRGRETFRHAVERMAGAAHTALEEAGWKRGTWTTWPRTRPTPGSWPPSGTVSVSRPGGVCRTSRRSATPGRLHPPAAGPLRHRRAPTGG
ncbi:3-oxoacyl-ACP synthase [Streptomyces albireticuli]|uniref:3-oxoacyl-ACP synthase n=1 Tax=Streptomyces albireticuli TaxID=1940 RepID=A0A1Z2LEC5_9ACTN|nr:3-oxoacyl-ACP synthase [Streptomyces albireticuli]